jgi:hypothetical protein
MAYPSPPAGTQAGPIDDVTMVPAPADSVQPDLPAGPDDPSWRVRISGDPLGPIESWFAAVNRDRGPDSMLHGSDEAATYDRLARRAASA